MVIAGLLTTLAKKLLKDKVKKLGKAVYNRTLKPVLEGLKKKAKEYVSNLARKPSARKAKKAQRELDKINEDIRTVETERAKLPGGPDFGDGPEIELGAPPKGNRLPIDDPVPPDAFAQELGEGHTPGANTLEAELDERMAVELEEELAAFHPKYVKGVSVTDQIMEAIKEQEQYVFREAMICSTTCPCTAMTVSPSVTRWRWRSCPNPKALGWGTPRRGRYSGKRTKRCCPIPSWGIKPSVYPRSP